MHGERFVARASRSSSRVSGADREVQIRISHGRASSATAEPTLRISRRNVSIDFPAGACYDRESVGDLIAPIRNRVDDELSAVPAVRGHRFTGTR